MSVSAGPLRLTEITTTAALAALKPAWDRVLAASETSTPFQTHAWALSWWETFAAHQELWVLLLEDDDGPAAIAPFARARRRAGPLRYRALEFLGSGPLRFLGMGLSDRCDFLLARRRNECLDEIIRHLTAERRHWDVLDLRFVPEESTTARRCEALAALAGFGHVRERCAESPYLALEGSYEDYLKRRSSNFRKGLKRKLRRLEGWGEVAWDLSAESDVDQALDEVVTTSLASWKAEAGSALFLHGNVREFWRRLAPRLKAESGLYVALATVGGRTVAHELGFRMGGRLWSYDSAFKAEFAEGSPGILLTAKLIEQAYADGLVEYDFMRGNEGYKLTWETATRAEVQIVLDSGSTRAQAARDIAYRAKWALKRKPLLVEAQSRAAGVLNKIFQGRRKVRA